MQSKELEDKLIEIIMYHTDIQFKADWRESQLHNSLMKIVKDGYVLGLDYGWTFEQEKRMK